MTLKEATNNEEINRKVEEAANFEEASRILEEYGVEVTEEELASLIPAESDELTDENLEDVAGGISLASINSIIRRFPPPCFPVYPKIPRSPSLILKLILSNPLLKKIYKL